MKVGTEIERVPSLRLRQGLVSRVLGAERVVVDLDSDRIFRLNPTASRLFELLGEADRAEWVSRLLAEYDLSPAAADAAIDEFLGEATRLSWLEPAPAAEIAPGSKETS